MVNKNFATTLLAGQIFFIPFAFVLTSKPVFAYCVYNDTSKTTLYGIDVNAPQISNHWQGRLYPGKHDCCPGKQSECQNAKVRVFIDQTSTVLCVYNVDPHGWIRVTQNKDGNFVCGNYRKK